MNYGRAHGARACEQKRGGMGYPATPERPNGRCRATTAPTTRPAGRQGRQQTWHGHPGRVCPTGRMPVPRNRSRARCPCHKAGAAPPLRAAGAGLKPGATRCRGTVSARRTRADAQQWHYNTCLVYCQEDYSVRTICAKRADKIREIGLFPRDFPGHFHASFSRGKISVIFASDFVRPRGCWRDHGRGRM